MTLLALNALSVTFADTLFADLSFTLGKGDRLGLVAANGRGKSTLLSIIAGHSDPTTGTLTRARGLRVGQVEQDVPPSLLSLTMTGAIEAALPDPDETWRAIIAMDDLGIPEPLRDQPLSVLSGGWQRVAMIGRALVGDPDILLLDEPTNHLDLSRIGWLERFLTSLPRDIGLIIASHDRAFLDTITTRTLFLRPEKSAVFALPYSRAKAALAEVDAATARQFDNDMKAADQLRRQAAKLKNIGINSGSDLLVVKTKQLTERADKMEQAARPAHREKSAGEIRLAGSSSHARALITLDDAQVSAPDGRALFKTGKLWIVPGDRVVLLGPNGAGKTQLVQAIRRATLGEGGAIRAAPSVVTGFSDQHLSELTQTRTAAEAITHRFDVGDQRARALLAGAGIGIDLQTARLSALSGGQRARLAMLILRLTNPSFYLLDEPTNHLDIDGQEALERELQEQEAAALIVSHDRAFVRAVGTRFWLITGKKLVEIDGPEAWFKSAEKT